MHMQVVEESELDARLDAAIREALCGCFPKDKEVFSKTRAWHGSGPLWSIVIEEDSQVTAHCGVVDRTIKAGNRQVHVAGIQNVFVRPSNRGKGLCKQVIRAAMAEASRRGYDCGLLFCEQVIEKIYSRSGWITIRPAGSEEVIRVDEKGREVPIVATNVTMYYPIRLKNFPAGRIHLQGNDW